VSKLTIAAPKSATGLEVRRNGELLGSVLWGNAAPVDPGSYTIEASAPGKRRWSSVATVGPNGAHVTVTIPPLEPFTALAAPVVPPFPPATGAVAPPPTTATVTEKPTDDEKPRGTGQRTAGIVVTAAGIVGVGVGFGFGVLSIAKHSEYTSHCTGDLCDAEGVGAHNDAVTAGNVATGTLIGSVLLVGGGLALWLSAPKSHAATAWRLAPVVGAGQAGLSFTGGWL
jgi:hypothetical protein